METLTKKSVTQNYCQERFHRTKLPPNKLNEDPDPWAHHIRLMERNKIVITKNPSSINKMEENVLEESQHDHTLSFSGKQVPICTTSNNYKLWGAKFKPEENTIAIICTDGSTDPKQPSVPSGAAYVFADDSLRKHEYKNYSLSWTILQANNYVAEMAAINRGIRSIPVTVALQLYTDSESSIKAIQAYIRTNGSTPPLRCTARPYLISIARAIATRQLHGASTTITHVRAHTGLRDLASIGNAAADRQAKEAHKHKPHDINTMENELPFVAGFLTTDPEGETITKHIHNGVRDRLKDYLTLRQVEKWAERPSKGRIIRTYSKQTYSTMLLDLLNSQSRTEYTEGKSTPHPCTRCATFEQDTALRIRG